MTSTPDEAIKQFQIIEILQGNDYVNVTQNLPRLLVATSGQLSVSLAGRPSNNASKPNFGTPLHLAAALCSKQISYVLFWNMECYRVIYNDSDNFQGWVNTTNVDGETPLHIASKHGRLDIVELLLSVPHLDDTIRNAQGKFSFDVAKNERVRDRIKAHVDSYRKHLLSQLQHLMSIPDSAGIINLFTTNERAVNYLQLGWFDLNMVLDPVTEQTLLHKAAKREDMALVEFCLANGADPSVKDKKGHKPVDLLHKKSDEKLRKSLKNAIHQSPIAGVSVGTTSARPSNDDSDSILSAGTGSGASNAAPSMKGVLHKWVNYASGYKSRFFALEDGILSYYSSESNYPHYCRGSIRADYADVHPDSGDKSKFEVHGTGKHVKWILKARSQADVKKWVWALVESRQWMLDRLKRGPLPSTNFDSPTVESEGEESDTDVVTDLPTLTPQGSGANLSKALEQMSVSGASPTTQSGQVTSDSLDPSTGLIRRPSVLDEFQKGQEEWASIQYMLKVQLDIQLKCVESVVEHLKSTSATSPTSMESGKLSETVDMSSVPQVLKTCQTHISEYVTRLMQLYEARERVWTRKMKKEEEKRRRWEGVMRKMLDVEVEMEREKYGLPSKPDETSQDSSQNAATTNNGAVAAPVVKTSPLEDEEDEFFDAVDDDIGIKAILGFADTSDDEEERTAIAKGLTLSRRSIAGKSPVPPTPASTSFGFLTVDDISKSVKSYIAPDQLHQLVRQSLPLGPDTSKPSLSLWSFLKSAFGKDLAKVTLPVYFNEPLTMLQRFSEDFEYSEILSLAGRIGSYSPSNTSSPSDKIALPHPAAEFSKRVLGVDMSECEKLSGEDASLLRLMLVAAFGMTNYSSTLNRINKPFNPMLGETYELVSESKQFRYISEQVCHHPPISACYCEAPDYVFWGEVNFKSKFKGKSLDIQPQGNNHVKLPVYEDGRLKGTEHLSWKKVTTSVNGLITGNLWIVHTGDLVVKNWNTGEECTLSLVNNGAGGGWFGLGGSGSTAKNAKAEEGSERDLQGVVKDKLGRVRWTLKGRWDDKLVAYPDPSHPSNKANSGSFLSRPITLWIRNPTPANSAANFHFTSFAMSLNEISPTLHKALPPTDSRLRKDQRAMEEGKWSDADANKVKLENIQRERRKAIVREFEMTGRRNGPSHLDGAGLDIGEEWWTPRWFVREQEPDTQQEHWVFTGEYWTCRDEAEKTGAWPDWVVPIFEPISDPMFQ